MNSKYVVFIFLFLLSFYFRAQHPKTIPTQTVYNNTKFDKEKTKVLEPIPKSGCDDDSMKIVLKTAPQDTNKLNQVIAFCLKMKYSCSRQELLPYALENCKLADSLVKLASGKNLYHLKNKQARCNNIVGIIHNLAGDFDSAFVYFSKGLAIRESMGDSAGMIISYNNIGSVFRLKADFVKATSYNLKALKLSEGLGDSSATANSCFHLSRINANMKNYQKALSYGLTCLNIYKKLRYGEGIAEGLSNLSEIYVETGDTLKSLACELEAMRITDSLGMLQLSANSINNIAGIYQGMGNLDLALNYFKKAARIYSLLEDNFYLATASLNISRICFLKNDFTEARRLTLLNLENLRKYPECNLEGAYNLLAECDSSLGNFKEALMYIRLSQSQHEINMNVENLKAVNELETKYSISKKEGENKLLSQQNQIQSLELKRNRYFISILVAGLILIFLSGLLLVRQNRLRSEEGKRKMELRLLRSQMNPHFIFNSLQAIQNYILKNEVKESIKYLNAFAALTREVLENSRTELIPISKEIKLLKNYLELQKLRFGNRFDYSFHTDDDIETDSVLIPPMLSQPFIENAIEHGMSDVESGGKIDLYFKMNEGYFAMVIIDNGKGLGNNDQGSKTHVSLATAITKERIALMNKRSKNDVSFTIEEAYPELSDHKGVKVIFHIPFNLA